MANITYRMQWKDVEDQLMIVTIRDTMATPNPHNFRVRTFPGVDDLMLVIVNWNFIPGAFEVQIKYQEVGDETITNIGNTATIPGYRSFTLPAGNYIFWATIKINLPGGMVQVTNINLTLLQPQLVDLRPAGQPLDISVINNSESANAAIQAKQAVIKFLSNANFQLSNFAGADNYDNRYEVTVERNVGYFIFRGYLLLDDMDEPFLAPTNEVILTATDRLGTLKSVAMVKPDGLNPTGPNRIADYLSWCLRLTGQNLPVNVIMNIEECRTIVPYIAESWFEEPDTFVTVGHPYWRVGKRITIKQTTGNNITATITDYGVVIIGPHAGKYRVTLDAATVNAHEAQVWFYNAEGHLFDMCHIDAKTFEKEIGLSEDCYTVLSKIVGSCGCFLTQEKGEWWIKRPGEISEDTVRITKFDSNGQVLEVFTSDNYPKAISVLSKIKHVNKATRVSLNRPIKSYRKEFRYIYPRELVCNMDFSRGDGDAVDATLETQTLELTPQCWFFFANIFDGTKWTDGDPQAGAKGVMVKKYEWGYEKDRYLYNKHEDVTGDDVVHYFKSEAIEVKAKDKISIAFDFRLEGVGGATSLNPGQVTLIPDDGSEPWYWQLDDLSGVNQWVQRATPTTNPFSVNMRWQGTDSDEWQNVGGETAAIPADGKLYIHLCSNFNIFAPYLYTNLQVTLSQYINGSYRKYSGHYYKITQPGDYFPQLTSQLFMDVAPGKMVRGALLIKTGTDHYTLAERFIDKSVYPNGSDNDIHLHPFGWHIVHDSFNRENRVMRTFRCGDLKGLCDDDNDGFGYSDVPGLLHHYRHLDASPHGGVEKIFQLLSFRQEFSLARWSATFREVFDNRFPKLFKPEWFEGKYFE